MTHRVTLIPGDGVGPEITAAARRIIEAAGVAIDVGGGRGGRRGVQARRQHRCAARDRRLDRAHRRRAQGSARDARSASARRAPTSRCASCSRPTPTSGRRASSRASPPATTARASTSSSSARTSRTSTRASSTSTPGTSRWRSRSSAARARRRSSATPSSWPAREGRAQGHRAPPRPTSSSSPRGCSSGSSRSSRRSTRTSRHEHLIIDNVAHQMAKDPAQFDVIVTTNLAGDIISDLASGLVGGPGLRGLGQLRRRRRDLRGGPRVGAQVRGQERHQPDRAHPVAR